MTLTGTLFGGREGDCEGNVCVCLCGPNVTESGVGGAPVILPVLVA